MRTLLALVVALACAGPVAAQGADYGALFGMTPDDAQGAIAASKAFEAKEAADRDAKRAFGLKTGMIASPRFEAKCVIGAVAKRLQVELPADAALPDVHYESELLPYDFQVAYSNEYGHKARVPGSTVNIFMPRTNQIFLKDGRFSNLRYSLDAALAREAAMYVYYRYQGGDKADEAAQAKAGAKADQIAQTFDRAFARSSPCDAARP